MKYPFENSVSTVIHADREKVWKAITDPAIIKTWFFGTQTDTDWKPGSPIKFSGEYEGKKYQDKGTILENVPGSKIKYNYWSSMSDIEDKPENYANITYALKDAGDGNTELSIHQDNIPDEQHKEHSASNWKMVLKQLKEIVEKEVHST